MGTISRSRRQKPQPFALLYYRANKAVLVVAMLCFWGGCQWALGPEIVTSFREPRACSDHDKHKKDVCFVTCIFGNSVEEVDTPANVEWFRRHWCSSARFDLVTNLPGLPAPGWARHMVSGDHSYGDFSNIVQSREAKFLAWRALPYVKTSCRMVVYLDGYLSPKHSYFSSTLSKFQELANRVEESKWGLAQVQQPYFNGLTMTEIFEKTILEKGKDTSEHANATLAWLQKQDDYQEVMTYYLNKYLAYDPNNPKYQQLSSWFWEQYTSYGGSWRDQPLWAYTIHHFGATPVAMTHDKRITRGGDLFVTGGTIGWNQHVHVPK